MITTTTLAPDHVRGLAKIIADRVRRIDPPLVGALLADQTASLRGHLHVT